MDLSQIIVELSKENTTLKYEIKKLKENYRLKLELLWDRVLYDEVMKDKDMLKEYGYKSPDELKKVFIESLLKED